MQRLICPLPNISRIVLGICTFGIFDGNSISILIAIFLCALVVFGSRKKILGFTVLSIGLLVPLAGKTIGIIGLILFLCLTNSPWVGLFLLGEYLLSPWLLLQIQTMSIATVSGISFIGFIPFLISSVLTVPFALRNRFGLLQLLKWFFWLTFSYCILIGSAQANILSIDLFTNDSFRAIANGLLTILGISTVKTVKSDGRSSIEIETPKRLAEISFVFALGGLLALILNQDYEKRTNLYFDEAHGRWETVLSSFGPDDYGRGAYYTYSELPVKAESWGYSVHNLLNEDLPDEKGILFFKTPTQRLSENYVKQVEQWVRTGGSAIFVADHTDLYDSSQNLNELLAPFGYSLRLDACFDRKGMPNKGDEEWGEALLGQVFSGTSQLWMTGTSFKTVPWNAVSIADYGSSFSEIGDYSKPNRFSNFLPSWEKDFFRFSGIAYSTYGEGRVVVVLDSTPWSNFSIFKNSYQRMFLSVLHVSEHGSGAYKSVLLGCFLVLLVSLALLIRNKIFLKVFAIVAIPCGCAFVFVFNLKSLLNIDALLLKTSNPIVITGSVAQTFFMNELLLPGENNYSRAIASLGKYGLTPIEVDCRNNCIFEGKDQLYIDASTLQLPSSEQVLNKMRNGQTVVAIFSKHRSTEKEILNWLRDFGLHVHAYSLPTIQVRAKSHQLSLLRNRELFLTRQKTILVAEDDTSQLYSVPSNGMWQKFRIRPAKMPYRAGELIISFDAELISDINIGDVWEGAEPSVFGVRAERSLADLFIKSANPYKIELRSWNNKEHEESKSLTQYAIWEGGKKLGSGSLADLKEVASVVSFNKMRNEAVNFIKETCPRSAEVTVCDKHLISSDLTEWQVRWIAENNNKIKMIELIHNKSFSGIGTNISVIFAK